MDGVKKILFESLGGITLTIDEIAAAVINKLRGKVVIHRYDAYSTNSVYLKFDYGVANSLRISDHPGKKYLKYRFNILTTQKCKQIKHDKGFDRIFYGPDMINAVCRDILNAKEAKKARYRDYDAIVQNKINEVGHEKGFWQQAVKVE